MGPVNIPKHLLVRTNKYARFYIRKTYICLKFLNTHSFTQPLVVHTTSQIGTMLSIFKSAHHWFYELIEIYRKQYNHLHLEQTEQFELLKFVVAVTMAARSLKYVGRLL